MSPRRDRIPGYRLHRPSGLAVVTIGGKDHYLGPYGTAASRVEYDRLIGEWLANGRRAAGAATGGVTVAELILAYWGFAKDYYVKDGEPTSQLGLIRRCLRPLREFYGREPAAEFGPLKLKAIRRRFVEQGLARETCNGHVARIRRMFRWGVEHELVPPAVDHGLRAVRGLAKGRTEAPDHPPVGPVEAAHVEAILPLVRRPIAAMIRLQALTGMRPGEVVIMRGKDLDMSGPVWAYRPESHKTEHHGKSRVVLIGPQAQEVLKPWLVAEPARYLFFPKQIEGRGRKRVGQSGPHYSARHYGKAIREACRRAGIPAWSPNRLRHSVGTSIRQRYGLEAAQVVLGHAKADVTQVYAERDRGLAQTIMAEIG